MEKILKIPNADTNDQTTQESRARKYLRAMKATLLALLDFVRTQFHAGAEAVGQYVLRLLQLDGQARVPVAVSATPGSVEFNARSTNGIVSNQAHQNSENEDLDDANEANDDELTDDQTETSTLEFEHEPFATFQSRVLNLVKQAVWKDADDSELIVERLKGGGYNRVVGVSRILANSSPDDEQQVVVRVPRFEDVDILVDVAAFQFVSRYTNIPVPIVMACDNSKDNALESHYMIQTRIYGFNAVDHYLGFTQAQKRKFATELGQVYRNMTMCQSSVPGKPHLSDADNDLSHPIHIAPIQTNINWLPAEEEAFHQAARNAPRYKAAASVETAPTLMHQLFSKLERHQFAKQHEMRGWPWTTFMRITSDLEARGWLNGGFSLAHMDMHPRNILVNPYAHGSGIPVVTGVLDWDSAVLAPTLVACKPPQWIWGWSEDGDEDETEANDEPGSAENKELKRLFEAAAGPLYMKYAYGQANRMARKLFQFALDGCNSTTAIEEAKELIDEWNAVRQLAK